MKHIIGIVGWFISALVLLKGWGWFMVPLGFPQITFWHAMGLGFFSNCFYRMRSEKSQKEIEESRLEYHVANNLLLPPILLGIMWLVSLGM